VTIVKELEKIYSEKDLNLDKFYLKIKKMSKYLENKKVNAYRKRIQSERTINEESKNAPMTAAERMRRMRQRRQFEASTSRTDAATPDASSQAMDVDTDVGHGSN
jgi:transcription elongation GreA/GreB family factor